MSDYDFSGLTPAQADILTRKGWEPRSGKQPNPLAMRKLIERGLVVARPVQVLRTTVTAYDVPAAVHAAWCAWRGEREGARAP